MSRRIYQLRVHRHKQRIEFKKVLPTTLKAKQVRPARECKCPVLELNLVRFIGQSRGTYLNENRHPAFYKYSIVPVVGSTHIGIQKCRRRDTLDALFGGEGGVRREGARSYFQAVGTVRWWLSKDCTT
jgi:hypothetical protein